MNETLSPSDYLLDNYLNETIDNLNYRLDELAIKPEYYCTDKFVNICKEMIEMMQNDRKSILLILNKAVVAANKVSVTSCSSFLKIYYATFIINLNLFIKTYTAVIKHISKKNTAFLEAFNLDHLQELIISRVSAGGCFLNFYNNQISLEWKPKLLDDLLRLNQAEYIELVESINFNCQTMVL